MTLRKGTRFLHRHWLDASQLPERKPLTCVVTRVAHGHAWYRPDYGKHDDGSPWLGSSSSFPLEVADRYVTEVLEGGAA